VSPDAEEIPGDPVHRQKSLGLSRRIEPSHLSLSLSGRLVGHLRAIVLVSAGVVDQGRHDRSRRCRVAPQSVGHQPPRLASLTFQQLTEETLGRTPIATRLNKHVDHVAVLVDSTPEIVLLTLDVHEELIQVSRISQATLSPFEATSILGTELPTPLPDGLVRDHDPSLYQKILDVSEAQAEAVVEPDGVADDLRRESVSSVADRIVLHRASLPATGST
jgi:hypothetical protein